MIPILYESTEKNFTTNGLGRLKDATSCYVIEERNGSYELEMEYPVNGIHYGDLKVDRIIYAMPADRKDPQPFRIYKISRPLSGQVSVSAEHISYLLATAVVMPFTASSCVEAINYLNTGVVGVSDFTFWTDKSVTGTYKLEKPTEARSVLGGTSGSILDTYGTGEYEFDGFTVKLHLHRGEDRGVTIRYGKNLADLTAEQDITNVYTGIVPYASNQDDDGNEISVVLPEKVIKSEHTGDYAYPLYKVVDFSSSNQDGDEGTLSVDELRSLAEDYVKSNEGWEIADSLTVSFVALWQTDEYKNIAPLERVSLCDTVHVIYTDLGVNVKAKVTKTDFDVLNERYNSIELGEASNNLSKTLNEAINESNTALSDKVSALPAAIKRATNLITGGLGGYVVIKTNANSQPEELLIMDTDDIDTATKVWRWNQNGLGYSSNGYSGSYDLAMTKNGEIVADFITTGSLTANVIKAGILSAIKIIAKVTLGGRENYWDLTTGEFALGNLSDYIASDGTNVFVNITNGHVSGNTIYAGVISSKSGEMVINLDNGTITVNQSGSIQYVKDDGSYSLMTPDSIGFYDKNANIVSYFGRSYMFLDHCYMRADRDNTDQNLIIDGSLFVNELYYYKSTDRNSSDWRLKRNIKRLNNSDSARFILSLKPSKFRYKEGCNPNPEEWHHGLIAQEVQEAEYDEFSVVESKVRKDIDGKEYLTLHYENLITDMIATIQYQNNRIDDLESRLNSMEKRISELTSL